MLAGASILLSRRRLCPASCRCCDLFLQSLQSQRTGRVRLAFARTKRPSPGDPREFKEVDIDSPFENVDLAPIIGPARDTRSAARPEREISLRANVDYREDRDPLQTAVSACPMNWGWLELSSETREVKEKVSEFGTEMHYERTAHE